MKYAIQSLGEVISEIEARTPEEAKEKIDKILAEEFKKRHAVRIIEVM